MSECETCAGYRYVPCGPGFNPCPACNPEDCTMDPAPSLQEQRDALLEALKHWKCERCSGLGSVPIPFSGDITPDRSACPDCDGSGMHPRARAAIALAERGKANSTERKT